MSDKVLKEVKEWVISIAIAAAIAFLIKGFLIDTMLVDGRSMEPILQNRDRIIFEKVSIHTSGVKRGQIIILHPPNEEKYVYYVKRVIGLPGEKVEVKNGHVYINDELLKEDYLPKDTFTATNNGSDVLTVIVPKDSIFVLGDNRGVSQDSRIIGTIPINNIKGHAVLRIFPFNSIKSFK